MRPAKRKDDVVLALTTTGMVKVWTLLGHENRYSEPIYENESKQIRTLNAVCLQCCYYNQRTVLVVCTKYWQIYDAGIIFICVIKTSLINIRKECCDSIPKCELF